MATEPKPTGVPDPKPQSAQQAVAMVKEDANWVAAVPDLNSTDGIKKNITALWDAIHRLAAYIDGDLKNPDYVAPPATTHPVA